jgi:formate dehydrogenase subunit beta
MDTHWMIETHGDPLLSVHGLLSVIWNGYGLEKMMVPADGSQSSNAKPAIYDKINQLDQVNPFRPIMASNTARFIPEFIKHNSTLKLGVILRPCELRSFIEMTKHKSIPIDNLVTICVDCLGTYPIDEFQWRSQRKGSIEGLTLEAIKNARQGSLVPYRFRPSCQMCTAPDANGADINLEIIGIPVRKYFLVTTKKRGDKSILERKNVISGEASLEVIEVHDKMLAKITERNGRVKDRVMRGLSDVLPANVDELISHLSDCGSCQKCILNCPICSVEMPNQTEDGKYLKEDLMRWLISCSGCGMCEQSCPQDQPLATIFGFIRDQLIEPLNYIPGRSWDERLPIL